MNVDEIKLLPMGAKVLTKASVKFVYYDKETKLFDFPEWRYYRGNWKKHYLPEIIINKYGTPKGIARLALDEPLKGIFVGWRRKQTGYHHSSSQWYDEYSDPPYWSVEKVHIVGVVQLISDSNYYAKPIFCLSEDVVLT